MKLKYWVFLLVLPALACKETNNIVDTPVKMFINNVNLLEGNDSQTMTFRVVLDKASPVAVSVDFATEDGTASAGTDYMTNTGRLTIPANELEGTIQIQLVCDSLLEADEVFYVRLYNATNATINVSRASGTIRNDDTYVPMNDVGYTTPLSYSGMQLAWHDEFDGNSINTNNWGYDTGNHGWGNNELQNYTNRPDNAFISDGKLVIEAKAENYGGSQYTSARLLTKNKQSFQYGRIDIRAKLPYGQGIWPALWMLGSNFDQVTWPECGEIDIMELVGHTPNTVHGTIHWGPTGATQSQQSTGTYSLTNGQDFNDEFHVFSLIWTENNIQWLVDDQVFKTIGQSTVSGNYPFNAPFFFIFNVAVGGNWPGNPNSSTVFPQRLLVDYVRVFQ